MARNRMCAGVAIVLSLISVVLTVWTIRSVCYKQPVEHAGFINEAPTPDVMLRTLNIESINQVKAAKWEG